MIGGRIRCTGPEVYAGGAQMELVPRGSRVLLRASLTGPANSVPSSTRITAQAKLHLVIQRCKVKVRKY